MLSSQGFPRSGSLDVIPSRETDQGKNAEMANFDLGRNSLGDMFSPIRDGKLIIWKIQ